MTDRRIFIGAVSDPECHRAAWVMADARTFHENGWILTAGGRIQDAGAGRPAGCRRVIDHGEVILMPGLVNAHTHLELSALSGRVPTDCGFAAWVARLLEVRAGIPKADLDAAARAAAVRMAASGVMTAGDIAGLDLPGTADGERMRSAGLSGIQFREYLGVSPDALPPADADHGIREKDGGKDAGVRPDAGPENPPWNPALSVSWAGHAPHTTTPALLGELKSRTRRVGLPFSLHLDESTAEGEFIRTGKGEWADLLDRRGLPRNLFPRHPGGPAALAANLGLLDRRTIAVHLSQSRPSDLRRVVETGASICLCPRSSLALHGRMADPVFLADHNARLCLGTDSLASAPSLDIREEMAALAVAYPALDPVRILEAATAGGASALGLETETGRLAPGFRPLMMTIEACPASARHIPEIIVHDARV